VLDNKIIWKKWLVILCIIIFNCLFSLISTMIRVLLYIYMSKHITGSIYKWKRSRAFVNIYHSLKYKSLMILYTNHNTLSIRSFNKCMISPLSHKQVFVTDLLHFFKLFNYTILIISYMWKPNIAYHKNLFRCL